MAHQERNLESSESNAIGWRGWAARGNSIWPQIRDVLPKNSKESQTTPAICRGARRKHSLCGCIKRCPIPHGTIQIIDRIMQQQHYGICSLLRDKSNPEDFIIGQISGKNGLLAEIRAVRARRRIGRQPRFRAKRQTLRH